MTSQSCSYTGLQPDLTGIFNDISVPETLTVLEVYYYTGCTQTGTAMATVLIDNTEFPAIPVSLAFANPPTPLFITYQFPSVTLTSLSAGQTLTFTETLNINGDAALDGNGVFTVVVPSQRFSSFAATVITTPVATVTSIVVSTSTSNGFSAAVLGGTAAGIAGGLIILGAFLFFIISRRRHTRDSRGNLDRPMSGVRKAEATAHNSNIPSGRLSTVY